MGRKFRDTEKTGLYRVKQKNGDIYVYERTYKYNPETRKTECLSNHLKGKIPAGTGELVPTRPKKQPIAEQQSTAVTAIRTHRTLTEILAWAGQASGIDEDLMLVMDQGNALKTISLARFLVATGGATVPRFSTWQFTHPIPYAEGLSESTCYALFRTLGLDETARQGFFRMRAMRLETKPLIAFDSTTVSTWSEHQAEARYGYNKAGDGLQTIKFTTIYAAQTRQPIAFGKQPGDLPDVTGLLVLLKQMETLGLRSPQIVTDNGYWSEANVMEMCKAHLDFITLAKPTTAWLQEAVLDLLGSIRDPEHLGEESRGVYVATTTIRHSFSYQRKYGSTKKGLKAGDTEEFTRTLYLHVCHDPVRKEQVDISFIERLRDLKRDLEKGIPLDEMKAKAAKDAQKYFVLKYDKNGSLERITWNKEACQKACRFHGTFVIVASHEKDGFAALRKYRRREKIEEFFKLDKKETDGDRPRVWHADTLMGRMLVQFAALCYTDFLRFRIYQLRKKLEARINDPNLTAAERKLDRDLLLWLKKTSFLGILEWFDAYEDIEVSDAIRRRRWNPQTTKRDRRFLSLLVDV